MPAAADADLDVVVVGDRVHDPHEARRRRASRPPAGASRSRTAAGARAGRGRSRCGGSGRTGARACRSAAGSPAGGRCSRSRSRSCRRSCCSSAGRRPSRPRRACSTTRDEAEEVDADQVVDRNAGQVLHGLERARRPAERVGGVDPPVPTRPPVRCGRPRQSATGSRAGRRGRAGTRASRSSS